MARLVALAVLAAPVAGEFWQEGAEGVAFQIDLHERVVGSVGLWQAIVETEVYHLVFVLV